MNPIVAALTLSLAASSTAAAQGVTHGIDRTHIPSYSDAQSRDFKVDQVDRQTKTAAIGPTGDLTLRNVVGDITVKSGGGRDVTIEIVRTSRGRTEADAKLGLEKVTVDLTVTGERAVVTTQYPSDRHPDYAVSVAYTVTAPAGTGVTVTTVTGRVQVSGLKGDVSARTVSGTVELASCARVSAARTVSGSVTLTDVQSDGDLEVDSVAGEVRLVNTKARRITASVVSGTISARDTQTDGVTLSSMSGNIEFSGSVTPKGRYEFRAHSGNVRLGLLGGFDLEAGTYSGRVEVESGLGIAPGNSQKSLRGVAGNGGAAVIATTFSGNVWVGRKVN
jgi:cytoskeletal protein CcmA (bactofilin family)